VLTAVANPQRMRVVAELAGGRVHVSELARRLGMSRPLLYMHLDRMEKAGLVVGQLELSEDGKAMKYFELAPFDIRLTAETIITAVQAQSEDGTADGGTASDNTANGNGTGGNGADGNGRDPDPVRGSQPGDSSPG
jgi:DNA-binding transcriptional ArsR family regulator